MQAYPKPWILIEGLDLAPSDLLEQYSKALNLAFYETLHRPQA